MVKNEKRNYKARPPELDYSKIDLIGRCYMYADAVQSECMHLFELNALNRMSQLKENFLKHRWL
jgi:hypothetical protein